MKIIFYIICVFLIWNFIVFLTYGMDKRRAKKNRWRISEKVLLTFSFCMGSIGAMVGCRVFRHKTQKTKFRILLPISLVFNILICVGIGYLYSIVF